METREKYFPCCSLYTGIRKEIIREESEEQSVSIFDFNIFHFNLIDNSLILKSEAFKTFQINLLKITNDINSCNSKVRRQYLLYFNLSLIIR